jgi:hypothetical protein
MSYHKMKPQGVMIDPKLQEYMLTRIGPLDRGVDLIGNALLQIKAGGTEFLTTEDLIEIIGLAYASAGDALDSLKIAVTRGEIP